MIRVDNFLPFHIWTRSDKSKSIILTRTVKRLCNTSMTTFKPWADINPKIKVIRLNDIERVTRLSENRDENEAAHIIHSKSQIALN